MKILILDRSYSMSGSIISESSFDSSIQGNYRNLDEQTEKTDHEAVEVEPKKDRERFRDKMRVKFKLKSSKHAISLDSNDEIFTYFESNLETVEKDSEFKYVPKVVVDCVKILEGESNHIQTPGLYRVSGNKTVIEALKKKLNDKKIAKKETKFAILKDQDVHCLTGLLKLFFRELTSPLMPCHIFVKCTSDKVTIEEISTTLINLMLPVNYQTLSFLMQHLKQVERNCEKNLMNSSNISICWGLCIFSCSFDATSNYFENDISKCNVLCKKMIDFYDEIFKSQLVSANETKK
jgi:hypothetical protein